MNVFEINIDCHSRGDIQSRQFTVASNSPAEAIRDVLTDAINRARPSEIGTDRYLEIRCSRQCGSVVLKESPGLNVNTISPPPRFARKRK